MAHQSVNHFISRYHIEQLSEEERVELASQVLSKIKETGSLPNPVHYAVIYESITKLDPHLGKEISDTIESGLYNNNIAEDYFRDLIFKYLFCHLPSEQVEALLQNLLGHIDKWLKETSNDKNQIESGINSLQQQDLPASIKDILENKILPAVSHLITGTNEFKEGAIEASEEINSLKEQLEQANAIAKTDELTKLPNRRAFNEFAQKILSKANQEDYEFSLVIADIDFFKSINDNYGHLIGDSVLRYLAEQLKQETKGKDFVGRMGGEEFVLLLPRTNYETAMLVADNLRDKISKIVLKVKAEGTELKLTISCGVATFKANDNIESILQRADEALYLAKDSGRNNVKGENDL